MIQLDKITEQMYCDFAKDFIIKYIAYPFGSMPKRDLDCLIFGILQKYNFVGQNPMDISDALSISESKAESYWLDYNAKFVDGSVRRLKSVTYLIEHIFTQNKKVEVQDKFFVFSIDNPVIRQDLHVLLKHYNYVYDGSFAKQLVKVEIITLFNFLIEISANDEDSRNEYSKQFIEIIVQNNIGNDELQDLNNKAIPFRDKVKDFVISLLKLNDKTAKLVDILQKFAPLAKDGINSLLSKFK